MAPHSTHLAHIAKHMVKNRHAWHQFSRHTPLIEKYLHHETIRGGGLFSTLFRGITKIGGKALKAVTGNTAKSILSNVASNAATSVLTPAMDKLGQKIIGNKTPAPNEEMEGQGRRKKIKLLRASGVEDTVGPMP